MKSTYFKNLKRIVLSECDGTTQDLCCATTILIYNGTPKYFLLTPVTYQKVITLTSCNILALNIYLCGNGGNGYSGGGGGGGGAYLSGLSIMKTIEYNGCNYSFVRLKTKFTPNQSSTTGSAQAYVTYESGTGDEIYMVFTANNGENGSETNGGIGGATTPVTLNSATYNIATNSAGGAGGSPNQSQSATASSYTAGGQGYYGENGENQFTGTQQIAYDGVVNVSNSTVSYGAGYVNTNDTDNAAASGWGSGGGGLSNYTGGTDGYCYVELITTT